MKTIKRFLKLFSLICICFSLFISPVYAGPGGYKGDGKVPGAGGYYDPSDKADTIPQVGGTITKIANIVVNVFLAVGVLLLIYGVALFIMSFRNDNPEERHKATIMFVVAIIFLGMRVIAVKIIHKTFLAAGYGSFIP